MRAKTFDIQLVTVVPDKLMLDADVSVTFPKAITEAEINRIHFEIARAVAKFVRETYPQAQSTLTT